MIYQGKARYPVEEVMLHCAAVKTGHFKGMTPIQVWATINEWHLTGAKGRPAFKNGFGYHGLFMPDGYFMAGRPYSMIGAGCIGKNEGVIHLLMIESKAVTRLGSFSDYFTEDQRASVTSLIRSLPGIERVSGHNDHAAKLCPGFKVVSDEWLNGKD